jgi:transposase-like protein
MSAPPESTSPPARRPSSLDDAPELCPRCHGDLRVVTVSIVEHPISMYSCGDCGYSRWRSRGETVDLSVVLDQLRVGRKSA